MNYQEIASRIKEKLKKNPCFGGEEDTRIFNKFIGSNGPRYLTKALIEKYDLDKKMIADLGCGYGSSLLFFGPKSYGVEISKRQVRFVKHIGLDVVEYDLVEDNIDALPKAEVVYSFDVLEHVENPHKLLRKMCNTLQPGGILILRAPVIPIVLWLRHITPLKKYITSYLHGDHINAYTPKTLEFFCNRAGFETIEVSPYYPFPMSILNKVPFFNRLMDGAVYVGRKISDWDYPENAGRSATSEGDGFIFKGYCLDPEDE